MKPSTYILLVLITLLSCSRVFDGKKDSARKLKDLDASMIAKPYEAADSLRNIDVNSLDHANSAYWWLLNSIVNERCGLLEKEDSMIVISEKYFKSHKDYLNLCRSLLYKGIIRYNQYKQDTLTSVYFTNAGNLMSRYKIEDPATKSTLYKYLGKLKQANAEYKEAEEYLKKSREISESINDSSEMRRLDLELFYVNLSQKNYSQALAHIAQYIDSDTLHPEKAYELNEAVSQFFIEREEFDIAVVYLRNMMLMSRKMGKGKVDKSALYHRMAIYFKNKNQLDSAIKYSQTAIAVLNGNATTSGHLYYEYLAGLYEAKGEMQASLINYKNAYESHRYTYSQYTSKNVSRIESLYDSSVREADIKNERNNIKFLTLLGLFVIVALTGTLILLKKRVKGYRNESHLAKSEKRRAEEEVNKMRFVNELNEVSTGLLNQLIQNISIEADRSRSGATDTADRLVGCITQTKKTSKERFAEIVQSNFMANYPNLKYLSNLTDFEKVVFILLDNGYSIKQVAILLDRTQSCISGEKSKIKDKILSRQDLPFNPKAMFAVFN